jgi:hypothetical protein
MDWTKLWPGEAETATFLLSSVREMFLLVGGDNRTLLRLSDACSKFSLQVHGD